MDDANPYLLLTPGPLSTSRSVKEVMLRDWCTWDDDYNVEVVQVIREELLTVAACEASTYTSVLIQGSGTFSVEAVIGSVIPPNGKLLVLENGAYGRRIAAISQRLGITTAVQDSGELDPPDMGILRTALENDLSITHVAVVHGETTTGMLNPIEEIGRIVTDAGRTFIVDAMSTFGGVPLSVGQLNIDYLISSANKCIQGVPGFGLIIARRAPLEATEGWARSLSLDLFDQWQTMERGNGKWRYTSPTHAVRAFAQALVELQKEGGVSQRHARYVENQQTLSKGMRELGFRPLLPTDLQSPIITAFHNPGDPNYEFTRFYHALKKRGFVIYPGKVTDVDTFRIGTIGDVYPDDIRRLLGAVDQTMNRSAH